MSEQSDTPTPTEGSMPTPTPTEGSMPTPTPTNETAIGSSDQESEICKRKERKPMKPRSVVWQSFEKFQDKDGNMKARCVYCSGEFYCDSKRNGIASLMNHLDICKKNPNKNNDKRQAELNLQPTSDGSGMGSLSAWKFDQDAIRKSLAHMIIIDELHFKFVEGQGFKTFMSIACPRFRIPSRLTIRNDFFQLYLDEKVILKKFLKKSCQRVCLTTDTWTSIRNQSYMCLTAHFIDNNWKLQKRILNFCTITSHKGEAIGKAIEKCLNEWGIDKVFTITVDNASSNDTAIKYLMKVLNKWGGSISQGKFLHMRCMAYIINLITKEGLDNVGSSVTRIRGAVKYIRQSSSRLDKFKTCIELEKIQSKALLCLDVATRWNSTYLMLEAAIKFQKAFERYEELDPHYRTELGNDNAEGVPDDDDWTNTRHVLSFLAHFYELTLHVSGSLYVTSNIFFSEITKVACLLKRWSRSLDSGLSNMAQKMQVKFDKYWGDPVKMNLLLFVPVILDPRRKIVYMDFAFDEMYGAITSDTLKKTIERYIVLYVS